MPAKKEYNNMSSWQQGEQQQQGGQQQSPQPQQPRRYPSDLKFYCRMCEKEYMPRVTNGQVQKYLAGEYERKFVQRREMDDHLRRFHGPLPGDAYGDELTRRAESLMRELGLDFQAAFKTAKDAIKVEYRQPRLADHLRKDIVPLEPGPGPEQPLQPSSSPTTLPLSPGPPLSSLLPPPLGSLGAAGQDLAKIQKEKEQLKSTAIGAIILASSIAASEGAKPVRLEEEKEEEQQTGMDASSKRIEDIVAIKVAGPYPGWNEKRSTT
ncbi:MAG TPA: hypothetical protein VF172_01030 [Nitrososphaera sp.]